MVSKCANPGCSAPFLYMRQGRLFRIETFSQQGRNLGPSFGTDPTLGSLSRRLEFFWLCDDCAPLMTVSFEPGRGVVVVKAQAQARAALAGAAL